MSEREGEGREGETDSGRERLCVQGTYISRTRDRQQTDSRQGQGYIYIYNINTEAYL